MKAAVISIGTEHLSGKIVDTNAVYISRELSSFSITTYARVILPDDEKVIEEYIKPLLDKVDIIFTIAGLGPTHDDITKEAVAGSLKSNLIFKNEIWELIKNRFKTFNSIPTDNNKKQAFIFENGKWYKNDKGTAPALYTYHKNSDTHFFLLPGPPEELNWLFENFIYNELNSICKLKQQIIRKIFRVYNAGESSLANVINPLLEEFKNIQFGIYVKSEGYIELDFQSTQASEKNTNQMQIFEVGIIKAVKKAGFYITENLPLTAVLGKLLKDKGLTIGFAESITGGSIMAGLVQVPGSSVYLKGGIVAYCNEVKSELLDVKKETLINHGAVSAECAAEMAKGAVLKLGCNIGVSITGIAGPTGDTPLKPIGLCYIGINYRNSIKTDKLMLYGNRKTIMKKAVNSVFIKILNIL